MLRFVSCGLAALTILALTAPTRTAHANPLPAETPDSPAPEKPIFIDVAAGAGWVSSSNASFGGGPAIGATLLFRYSIIEAGATADAATQLLSPASRVDVGGLVGVGSQERSFVGGDLLLEGGVRTYDGMGGCSFLCNYPGVSGSVPYVGLRAGATLHPIHTSEHRLRRRPVVLRLERSCVAVADVRVLGPGALRPRVGHADRRHRRRDGVRREPALRVGHAVLTLPSSGRRHGERRPAYCAKSASVTSDFSNSARTSALGKLASGAPMKYGATS